MIPNSLIFAASLLLLLSPLNNSRDLRIKKAREVSNYNSVNIDLRIWSSRINESNSKYPEQKVRPEIKKADLQISVEQIQDEPIQIEEWMKSPKKWNNNKIDKKSKL